MAHNLSMGLSVKRVNEIIDFIEDYKNSLQGKAEILADRLAQIGIDVVREIIEAVPSEDRGSYSVEDIHDPPQGVAIVLTGDKVLFIEFGAGVIYSNPQNPKAAEHGMGVGTYPGQKYAWNLIQWGGGWWYSKDGQSHHSYGNPAYMPMYKADVEILDRVAEIAKEVFGS